MFSFFQSLLTWRRLGAEPLTPRCRQKRSTTFVRSEWRRSWSEHARAHVRKRLCKRRTTQETLCLFYRKYTGSYQILIYTVKQHSNTMSQRVALFPFGFLFFFNSTSRNVKQKIKFLHHKTVMIWYSLFFQQTESRAAGGNTLQSLSSRKRDVSCIG